VNIASRVESLTKTLGTDILITESLYQLVKDEVEVIDRGEHELKGREENQVKLYTLVSLKGEDTALYEQAIADLTKYLQKPH
jgi:adenylate cyclase